MQAPPCVPVLDLTTLPSASFTDDDADDATTDTEEGDQDSTVSEDDEGALSWAFMAFASIAM